MPETPPLCLNRIISPQLPLPEFFQFASDLGFQSIELRNDLAGKEILDGLPDDTVRNLVNITGIKALTINALYPFENARALDANVIKLKGLISEAKRIDCSQIVLCPLNEAGDPRSPGQRADQLVASLNAFGPLFAEAKMTGLIEPLGFSVSALRTKKEALAGISQCDYSGSYKLLHDTFHHYLGEETDFFPAETALVHVSGVLPGKARSAIADSDRVLVTGDDILDNRGQVATLLKGGYKGSFSYEPFSQEVQSLPVATLKKNLQKSIQYLFS
ncbi:MAG TPA: TIM barrel protein [Chthoniobacterales bacterium]|nr:TIM barrel protein [Chthoniobacterales bacterium]